LPVNGIQCASSQAASVRASFGSGWFMGSDDEASWTRPEFATDIARASFGTAASLIAEQLLSINATLRVVDGGCFFE